MVELLRQSGKNQAVQEVIFGHKMDFRADGVVSR